MFLWKENFEAIVNGTYPGTSDALESQKAMVVETEK